MDIRIQKSKKSIINAFIGLRSQKPLERITVTELCRQAEINKSTFYSHYQDIYDLSDQLEDEVVDGILQSLGNPAEVLTDTKTLTIKLFEAYTAKNSLIQILFSGNRTGILPRKIEKSLKEWIFSVHPESRDDSEKNIKLSYQIYGGYYAYQENQKYGAQHVTDVISNIVGKI